MEEREEGVVLYFEDVLLQLSTPGEVLGPLDVVSVASEGGEEGVEARGRAGGNVVHDERLEGGLEGSDGRDPRDVVDGDHVDRVVDIGDRAELDTALDESPEEVVRVRHGRLRVSDDVCRSDDTSRETSTTRFHDETLRDPLGLTVASLETCLRPVEVVRLGHSLAALLHDRIGETDVVSLLDRGSR